MHDWTVRSPHIEIECNTPCIKAWLSMSILENQVHRLMASEEDVSKSRSTTV